MARPLTVLVADDQPDTANTLTEVLNLSGFDAHAATLPLDALRLAADAPPDVVVMDLAWPGVDGYSLARSVENVSGRRPLLVAVTGHDGYEGRSRAEGFDAHFVKPVDPIRLVGYLRDHAGLLLGRIRTGDANSAACLCEAGEPPL
jgi:two-component system, OmpR family, response regulator